MHLYQIILPVHTNAGLSYENARKAFCAEVAARAGGYAELAFAKNVWRDPQGGRTYSESVVPLQFITDDDTANEIVDAFKQHFPDQAVACWARLGEGFVEQGR